jgi:phenylacetic acid degradation operon negative regulatory protein
LAGILSPRAKSLIVTVLGDALAPHGGAIWLGSLIALMDPFGINQRAVRTSVLRLVREDWLVAKPRGRRSYYSLTEAGRRRIADSERRIYPSPRWDWDGRWHFVFTALGAIGGEERARLRRTLRWLGFGAVTGNVFAHPRADLDGLAHALAELGLAKQVVTLRAEPEGLVGDRPGHELLGQIWNLDELSAAYRRFIERFAPFRELVGRPAPGAGFTLRILLMHEYRRVLLRDPGLPAQLLPADWAGMEAWTLARELYRKLAAPSQAHLTSLAETETGKLPPLAASFRQRFGGLDGLERAPASARRTG